MEDALSHALSWKRERWFPFKERAFHKVLSKQLSSFFTEYTLCFPEGDFGVFILPVVNGKWQEVKLLASLGIEVSAKEALQSSSNLLWIYPEGFVLKIYVSSPQRELREKQILDDLKNRVGYPKVVKSGSRFVVLKNIVNGVDLWGVFENDPMGFLALAIQALRNFQQYSSLNHGDLHLGQFLWADGDLTLLDFEGEVSFEIDPLKETMAYDWACLLRSLHYWCCVHQQVEMWPALEKAFFTAIPEIDVQDFWQSLEIRLLHEESYERKYRPDWLWIPKAGQEWLQDYKTKKGLFLE